MRINDAIANARALIRDVLSAGRMFLLEHEAKRIIEEFGINIPNHILANDIEEVKKAAQSIGFPVVLKVVSPDIIHKTDVGGVKGCISSLNELQACYSEILENTSKKAPNARIIGMLVEKMAEQSVEIIIGGLRDEQFGPAVMFGFGGVFVELIKDFSFRLTPINEREALEMMEETKGWPIMRGFRETGRLDVYTLAKTLLTVSEMISLIDEIKEIDLNPVFVYPSGISVVDARIILNSL